MDTSNDGGQESDVDIDEENIQDSEDATTLDTSESQKTNNKNCCSSSQKEAASKIKQASFKRGSK